MTTEFVSPVILAIATGDHPNHKGEPARFRYRRASLASLEKGEVDVAQVYATLAGAVALDELLAATRSIGGEW